MTRLYKTMGYGLTDLTLDSKGNIDDERINLSSILINEDNGDTTVRDFVRSTLEDPTDNEVLERVLSGWSYGHLDPECDEPLSSVSHLSETSLDRTIVLRPVTERDWFYRANMVITHEEEAKHGVSSYLTMLRTGPYPYSNHYVDLQTLERVSWSHIADWVRAESDKEASPSYLNMFAEEASEAMGIEALSHEQLMQRVVPSPPEEVIQLATYGELFTKPEYVYQLRPLIATYWR